MYYLGHLITVIIIPSDDKALEGDPHGTSCGKIVSNELFFSAPKKYHAFKAYDF